MIECMQRGVATRVCLVALAIVGASCTSGERSATSDLEPIEALGQAPIHSEVENRMAPGALAALQLETAIDITSDMQTRTQAAAQLWDFYATNIEQCAQDSVDGSPLPRIDVPPSGDAAWDLVREPSSIFRPFDEQWNQEHGFSSVSSREFWDSNQHLYDFPSSLDTPCAQQTYPFSSLISLSEIETHTNPLDSLALELLNQFDDGSLYVEWTESLDELFGNEYSGDAPDLPACMIDKGIAAELVAADYWEIFAESVPHPDAADFSVAEAACLEEFLEPIDTELHAAVSTFTEQHEPELLSIADTSTLTREWLANLS